MNTYRVTEIATGKVVYEYQSDSPVEWDGLAFATHSHAVVPAVVEESAVPAVERWVTKKAFLDLLGRPVVEFLLSAAKQNVSVEAWIKWLDYVTPNANGTSVDRQDPATIDGLAAMEGLLITSGVVSSGWAAGVLNG